MPDFCMPSLGADMDAGTIVEWRIGPGDVVHKGDVVAVVDTEKSDIDVEVFADGVVEEILVEPGRQVPVGTPLARIRPEGAAEEPEGVPEPEPVEAELEAVEPQPVEPEPVEPTPAAEPEVGSAPAAGSAVRASPLARRRAAEAGVDLAGVAGSGPDGAVVAADLAGAPSTEPPATDEARSEPTPSEPPGAQGRSTDRQASMRRAIAELMARSAREIPHYHLATTVDVGPALALVADRNATRPPAERLLPAALVLKATALAAAEVPGFNGTWDDGYVPAPSVDLGVAVALRGGGLLVPAIHDADRLPLDELMESLRDLVARARSGRLRGSEVAGPTLTVTNLGDQGAEEVHGVIYPPQVALVGVGRIVERPWAEDGMLGVRPTVRLTLAADHRASDGHAGSRFLAAIDAHLATPEDL